MNQLSLQRAQDLLRRNAERTAPSRFELIGREWILLDGVFSPAETPVTALFTQWLPFPTTSFLEMGCGTGVTAVSAALAGCLAVTAVDINAAAVANTRANAGLHHVDDQVRVVCSDMFAALDDDDRYDMIFWNSNFVEAPEDFVNSSPMHHALFDPAYRAHRAFLHEAPRHLNERGRLLLGFSDLGNGVRLAELADAAGLEVRRLRSQRVDLEVQIEFQLLELTAVGTETNR